MLVQKHAFNLAPNIIFITQSIGYIVS